MYVYKKEYGLEVCVGGDHLVYNYEGGNYYQHPGNKPSVQSQPVTQLQDGQRQDEGWDLLAFSLAEKTQAPGSGRDSASKESYKVIRKEDTRCPLLAPHVTCMHRYIHALPHTDTAMHTFTSRVWGKVSFYH